MSYRLAESLWAGSGQSSGDISASSGFYYKNTTMHHISAVVTPYLTDFEITLKPYTILFYFFSHGKFLLILVRLEKVKIMKLLTK